MKNIFRSRLELIQDFIHAMTDTPLDKCDKQALEYENKPFIVRYSLD